MTHLLVSRTAVTPVAVQLLGQQQAFEAASAAVAADLSDKETQLQVLQDALQSAKAELEAQQYATVGIREVNEKERQDLAALRQQLELQYVIVPWRCVLGLRVRTHTAAPVHVQGVGACRSRPCVGPGRGGGAVTCCTQTACMGTQARRAARSRTAHVKQSGG